jgi:hypothetical protein
LIRRKHSRQKIEEKISGGMLKPVIVGYQVVPRRPQNRSTLQPCNPATRCQKFASAVMASSRPPTVRPWASTTAFRAPATKASAAVRPVEWSPDGVAAWASVGRPLMPRSAFKVGSLSHNHPNSQPVRVASDASPSGVTKERSQSCRRPLQAKMVQTIAQATAPTAKRLKRATRAPSAFPSMFHPRIRLTLATRRTSTIRRSRDEVTQRCNVGPPCRAQNRSPSKEGEYAPRQSPLR